MTGSSGNAAGDLQESPASSQKCIRGNAVYLAMKSQSVYEWPADGLGDFPALVATQGLLRQSLPVWQTLLLGLGAVALIVWTADLVTREMKHARKSLGV